MADSPVLMTIEQLIEAVRGSCICNCLSADGFSSVATDSRKVQPGGLFVPLMGETQDGHSYIPKALEAGASVILVDKSHGEGSAGLFTNLAMQYRVCFVMVDNTLHALQDAARMYVSFFPDLLKIGITGSSGKTTTKEITAAIFSVKYNVVMNEGNLNSETGLPLSVFKIRKDHQVGIFELGMNRRGEIAEIARVLVPSLALITNIGTAHIGILGTQVAIAEEKKKIFSFFSKESTGFVPEDDPWRDFLQTIPVGNVRLFGTGSLDGFEGYEDRGIDGTVIRYAGLEILFRLPGTYNLRNALGAISLARKAGLAPEEIKKGVESVQALFGRTEILRGEITVIRDCYNANPDSMQSAIDFCDSLGWDGRKIFVLGSMLELGDESEAAHAKICRKVWYSSADRVFLFGDEMIAAGRRTFPADYPVEYAESMEGLSRLLEGTVKKGDLVFIKGSRGMALERVCKSLNCQGSSEGRS